VVPGTAVAGDLQGLARAAARRLGPADVPAVVPEHATPGTAAPAGAPRGWQGEAARALRAGTTTCGELLRRSLEQMDRWEPHIEALITRLDSAAVAAAGAAQAELEAGHDRGALHGIPLVVKDLIDVAGVPTTAASALLADNVAASDAPVITALRRAGAIVVAKANTHEFAFGALTPPTRNPWDLACMPGGSSGGSAAAVAAGYAPVALGTDTAGSVREPAALCGVVGLKPTFGRVSCAGVVPLAWTLDTVGPMGLTVADTAALFDAMAPGGAPRPLPSTLDGLRVGVVTELCDPLQEGPATGFAEVRRALAAAGCSLGDVTIGDPDELLGVVLVILGAEAASFHRSWFAEQPHVYGEDVRAYLDLSAGFSGSEYVDAQRVRRRLRDSVDAALADHDILLAPAQSVLAPRIAEDTVTFPDGRRGARDLNLIRPLAPFNLSGHPALSVPVVQADGGLPFSVQLVGPTASDEALFVLGAAVQQAMAFSPRLAPEPPG
jgi:aspartyl-tRNA(Asn)/glutamyl-tRNA(Gln) amidotransferase subunit A